MKLKNLYLKITFVIILSFIFNISLFPHIKSKEIDKLIVKALKEFKVVGVSIVIVENNKVVHIKGYGYKSIGKKKRVDENTLFAIASNSKAFTTTALSILVDEKKISWQTKVIDIIPEFRMYNSYVTENFMIEDLLTHRSGLGLGAGDLMFFPDGSNFTIKDIVKVFKYFKPSSPFRAHFDYDNLLYFVAGEIVKRVTGENWENFIHKRIFKPLGMYNSYTNYNFIKDKTLVATPHSEENGNIIPINHYIFYPDKTNGAAGGIYSCVKDLSKWIILHLNNGKYDEGKRLFSEKNHRKMWTIHTIMNFKRDKRYNTHFSGYGLGWRLKDIKGYMMVSHTGGLPGFLSKTVLIPDLNLGIVVLTNTSPGGGALFSAVTNTIIDKYLGLKEIDWIKIYKKNMNKSFSSANKIVKKVWEQVKKNRTRTIDYKNYEGIYKDRWFGKIKIKNKNGTLYFKSFRSPKLKGRMYYYRSNTFAIKWDYRDINADAFAIFCLDEVGKAVSFTMKGISPVIDFSFDFHDLLFKKINK